LRLCTGSPWSWLTDRLPVNFGLSNPIVFDFEPNSGRNRSADIDTQSMSSVVLLRAAPVVQ
jgi:hypothetical protein